MTHRDFTTNVKSTMNAVQREYIRNARKAVRIANDAKFNAVVYSYQANWAEAYWQNYLKSSGAKNLAERMARLKLLSGSARPTYHTRGALPFVINV